MSLIIISAEDKDIEGLIAQRVAGATSYQRLGPEQLPQIAAEFNLPADKLADALEKTPSAVMRRNTKRLAHWQACIEAGVLDRLRADNIVCWGLSAHLFVQGVSHALRVRLLMDQQRQAELFAQSRNISPAKAQKELSAIRRKREQWVQAVYKMDEFDATLYDLVINLEQIDPDEAVEAITKAIGYRKFKPMTYSLHSLADLALAAQVKAVLAESLTDFRVQSRDGQVMVTTKALKRERQKKAAAIKELAGRVPGVQYVEVHLINYVIRQAAESLV
jgi:cytidylate kinase